MMSPELHAKCVEFMLRLAAFDLEHDGKPPWAVLTKDDHRRMQELIDLMFEAFEAAMVDAERGDVEMGQRLDRLVQFLDVMVPRLERRLKAKDN